MADFATQFVIITSDLAFLPRIEAAIRGVGSNMNYQVFGVSPQFRFRTKVNTNFRSEPVVSPATLLGWVLAGKEFNAYSTRQVDGKEWFSLEPGGKIWVAGWLMERLDG